MKINKKAVSGTAVLNLLDKLKLPHWPRNFEVCYHYLKGDRPDVTFFLDKVRVAGNQMLQAEIDHIHGTCFGTRPKASEVNEASEQVASEIHSLLESIHEVHSTSVAYAEELRAAQAALSAPLDDARLSEIASKLADETEGVAQTQASVQHQLEMSRREIHTLQQKLEEARTATLVDPLTGLGNRRLYDTAIETSIADARESGKPLSILSFDIDHFKRFNDTYGHLTGDQILRAVAVIIRSSIKGADIACRHGGEEFIVILPNTGLSGAMALGENIRSAVTSKELVKRSTGESLGRITLSVGAAEFEEGDSECSLYERADSCLYEAKNSGRNKVVGMRRAS